MKLFKMMTPPIKASVIALLAFSAFADGTYEGSWIGLSGKVTIPAGVTAPVTAAELADFANVTEIAFADAEGAVTANGLTSELVLNATLTGAGLFSVSSCAKVTVNSANRDFKGRFYIYNTPVDVAKRYGLGSAADGTGEINLESPGSGTVKTALNFTGSGNDLRLENSVILANAASIGASPSSGTLIIATNVTQTVKGKGFTFTSNIRMVGGTVGNVDGAVHVYPTQKGDFWLEEGASGWAANSYYWSGDTGNVLHIISTNLYAGTALAVYTSSLTAICESDYCFNNMVGILFSMSANPVGALDLNGHDQRVYKLANIANNDPPKYCVIRSATPATLTLRPPNKNNYTVNMPVRFDGKVSMVFDPQSTAVQITNSFVAAASDEGTETLLSTSSGKLSVKAGTLALTRGWGWGGDVEISGGALLCESPVSLSTGRGMLAVSGSGKLFIGEGVTLNVTSAMIGNAALERYRTYTVAELNELDLGETTVEGAGSVYVGAPSVIGDWTGWPTEAGATAEIPNDATVFVTDEDVEKVEALSGIVLGIDSTLVCANTNVELAVSAAVVGSGAFTADGAKSVTLAGDFSNVAAHGRFAFKDTAVVVAGANELTIASSEMFTGECTLSLAGTAALEIAAGVEPLVYGGTFGTAELENSATYTTAELDALSDANDVTGEGVLRVGPKHIPGTWQGWPEVGTATKAEIPDGEVAEIAEEDVAKVEALSRIDLGFGSKIVLKTTETPLTLSAQLVGSGSLTAANAASLVLAGDNSRLVAPGAIAVTSTAVTVTHRYGLGGPNTGKATFYNALGANNVSKIDRDNNTLLIGNGECALTNDVPIEFTGSWVLGGAFADFPWVQNADLKQNRGGNQLYFWFTNRIVMIGGAFGVVNSSPIFSDGVGSGCGMDFETNGFIDTLNNSWYCLGGSFTFGTSSFAVGSFRPNTVTWFEATVPNAFDGVKLLAPYLSTYPYEKEWDMGGYDQWFEKIGNQNFDASKPGRLYALKADSPSTLLISNELQKAETLIASVSFRGQLSAHFAGKDSYRIADAVSTTEGRLQVSTGCSVEFYRSSGFNVSTNIVIDGGTVTVAEDAAETVFSRDANVTVTEGGKLVVADGRAVTIRALNLDGEWLPRGLWGGAAALDAGLIDADHCNSELFGSETTGIVKIRRSVTVGLSLIVR